MALFLQYIFTLFEAFLYLATAWLMRSLTRMSPLPQGTTTLTGPKQTVTFIAVKKKEPSQVGTQVIRLVDGGSRHLHPAGDCTRLVRKVRTWWYTLLLVDDNRGVSNYPRPPELRREEERGAH